MSPARVREHVNPLANRYKIPAAIPDWQHVYDRFDRPLHIDIGCARGRFVQQMAEQAADWNFLGLEIREPLVADCNEWRDELGLRNLHFLFCNANNTLEPLLKTLPPGLLKCVSIQFPDPWFKRKQHKRRVVQPELVQDLATYMAPDTIVFIQSDVLEVAQEMRDRFSENPAFQAQSSDWLPENPMPVPTERELSTLKHHDPVYRMVFARR
jgi:tRNA (guanine-N7-)-methyltransferase